MVRRVLYYALGGGLGHVTRTLAVARQFERLVGGEHRLLCNTPFVAAAQQLFAAEPCMAVRWLSSDLTAAAVQQVVREELDTFQPDTWIVDTFPRGLGGELPPLLAATPAVKKILIGRGIPDAYVHQFGLVDFVAQHYATVVIPGEPSPWSALRQAVSCAPFLIRDGDELLSRDAAARALHVNPSKGCVCVVGSGTSAECERLSALVSALETQWRDEWPPLRYARARMSASVPTARQIDHLPLLEWFGGVRLIIGSGGYNLVQETRATGLPALLTAQTRTYDDQAARLARHALADIQFCAAKLLELIADELAVPWSEWNPRYENGAQQAAKLM